MKKIALGALGIQAILLINIILKNTQKGFLTLYNIDEFEHLKYVFRMKDALLHGDITTFFSCPGFVYGFASYWVNFILTLPFTLLNNTTMAIVMPRMGSLAFVALTLWALYRFCKQWLSPTLASLITLLPATMPMFWSIATWNHPDAMMCAFFVWSLLYLGWDSKSPFSKPFWISICLFTIAVAAKLQIILFSPIWILYFIVITLRQKTWLINAKVALKALALSFGTYLLICPYLLHPVGRYAVIRSTLGTLAYNATNHGMGNHVTWVEKLDALQWGYGLLGLLAAGVFCAVLNLLPIQKKAGIQTSLVMSLISLVTLANSVYLLIGVNKAWAHYYAPVVLGLIISIVPWIATIQNSVAVWGIGVLILGQLIINSPGYTKLMISDPQLIQHHTHLSQELIMFFLGKTTDKTHILISAKTGFEYEKLGLSDSQVQFIYGPITQDMLFEKEFIKKWQAVNLKKYKIRTFYPKDWIILRKDDPRVGGYLEVLKTDDNKGLYELAHETDVFLIFKLNPMGK